LGGGDERSGDLFSYVDLEDRVAEKHPLRLIRRIVNEVLCALDSEFTKIYADSGRLDKNVKYENETMWLSPHLMVHNGYQTIKQQNQRKQRSPTGRG